MKRLTKAQLAMSEADAPLLESGGKTDFRWGTDPAAQFEPVAVDRKLKDGDTIALGGVVMTAHLHPGHEGSHQLHARRSGRRAHIQGGHHEHGQHQPGRSRQRHACVSGDRRRLRADVHAQKAIAIDVFLASHAAQFRMHEKFKAGDTYRPDRFVDPSGYRAAVDQLEAVYRKQMASER